MLDDCGKTCGCGQWRTQKILMGGFIQWHMVVICIRCALFVTSQFDAIFMLSNQPFREICWHAMHVLLHALPLIYVWSIESVWLDRLTHIPVCKIESCQTTQELRMRIKYARNLSIFLWCIEVQQTFSFPFSLLRHYQMSECFCVNNCCFWARATVLSCYRNWWCNQCGQYLRCSAIADKVKTIVSDKVNYRETKSWTCVVDERSAKSGEMVSGCRR